MHTKDGLQPSPAPAISPSQTAPGGGGMGRVVPPLVCPLIAIELRNKDESEFWYDLNLTIPDFTTLGLILAPRQVKQKMLLLV